MCTVFLAYVNAKYKHDYEGVFFLTFILDYVLLNMVFYFVA